DCIHRGCVELTHLEAVTPRVNLMRGKTLTRSKAEQTKCIYGHPFDLLNTYIQDGVGTRKCATDRRRRRAWNPIPIGSPYVPESWADRALEFEHRAVDAIRILEGGPPRRAQQLVSDLGILEDQV